MVHVRVEQLYAAVAPIRSAGFVQIWCRFPREFPGNGTKNIMVGEMIRAQNWKVLGMSMVLRLFHPYIFVGWIRPLNRS